VPTARDRPYGGERRFAPRAAGRAGPEAAARRGDRRLAGRVPHRVCDARRRGLYARGDRCGTRHRDGNFEGAVVARPRQVARGIGGLRRRVGVMTEDRFERFVRQAAQDYHRPPETPREELWRRIATVREARRRRRVIITSPWVRWGVGIAAVLALGVGIGRWTARPPGASQPVVVAGEGPARGPGAGAGANRSAPGERWQGRCAGDQPGTRTTQRAAAAADGEPRRPWPRAHARSTVMHAMQLVLAAVMAIQRPATPA